jgi:hypothetical protein
MFIISDYTMSTSIIYPYLYLIDPESEFSRYDLNILKIINEMSNWSVVPCSNKGCKKICTITFSDENCGCIGMENITFENHCKCDKLMQTLGCNLLILDEDHKDITFEDYRDDDGKLDPEDESFDQFESRIMVHANSLYFQITALNGKNIKPIDEWRCCSCCTDDYLNQLRSTLRARSFAPSTSVNDSFSDATLQRIAANPKNGC